MADEPLLITVAPEQETVAPADEFLARCIAHRYEIKRLLGSGASKDVFLARDVRLDRDVALARVKRARNEGALPPRVLQEIQTTARLDEHPHIVTVYDVIEEDEATWIVSQYVRGGTVADLIDEHPHGLGIPDALRIATDVAEALQFAHEHGVIHRDVKPGNVLLSPADRGALLADFGVAFLPDRPRLTVNGTPVGTAVYMSPEQARGEPVGPRSDLYSLGVMLFELVCGRPPFTGDSLAALVRAHLYGAPPDPVGLNSNVPPALGRTILQLLAKRTVDRPQSAQVLRDTLEALHTPARVPARRREPETALPSPLVTPAGRPLVGREAELSRLHGVWREAQSAGPCLAVVTGEAGIGKTSLAAAFAQGVQGDAGIVLYGRCDEDPLVSYQPFVEALRQFVVRRPESVDELGADWSAELAELSRLVPELRSLVVAPGEGGRTPQPPLERYQLFEAILALVAPAASEHRLLLVLDDMQWADEPTELLLRHVMRSTCAGLMVLVARRPARPSQRDPLAKLLEDLKRDADADRRLARLTVTGLDADETHALATVRRDHPVDLEFSRLLQAETAGHPFFIEQVLRGLHEVDLSVGASAAAALQSLRVPQEVHEFIEYRLGSFAPGAEDVLKQAAVCGPQFRLEVLAALRHEDAEQVIALLSEPIAAGLVVEEQIGRYSFSHALVRETIYKRGLGLSERAQLHLRIGETLERLGAETLNAAELALHFHAAREIGGAERTVTYALRAADAAHKALAYEEAAAYAREAGDALECLGSSRDADRWAVMQLAGQMLWGAGDQRGAQQQFLRAAELARDLGDATLLGKAALGYAGRSYHAEALDPVLRTLFDEALASVPPTETSLHAKLLARLAEALHPVDGPRAIQLTEQALDILGQHPDDPALITTLAARHIVLMHISHQVERLEVGKRWVQLAQGRRRHSLGAALNWRAYDLIERGEPTDIAAARDVRRRLSELARTLQQPLHLHFAACLDAKWLMMEGAFDDATKKAREGYQYGKRAQGTHVAVLLAGQYFSLSRDRGRLDELPHVVAPFLDIEHETLPAWRTVKMLMHVATGDSVRARTELHRMAAKGFAAVPDDMFWLGIMCLLAECAADLRESEVAAELVHQLEPYVGFNAQIGLSFVLGPVHAFVARLHALLGQAAVAERHFRAGLDRAEALRARPISTRIQCHYAESLIGTNAPRDRQHAEELVQLSLSSARALGMADIETRARAARDRIRAASAPTGVERASP